MGSVWMGWDLVGVRWWCHSQHGLPEHPDQAVRPVMLPKSGAPRPGAQSRAGSARPVPALPRARARPQLQLDPGEGAQVPAAAQVQQARTLSARERLCQGLRRRGDR